MTPTLVFCSSLEEGILSWTLDEAGAAFSAPKTVAPGKSFFLALHPKRPVLYSVNLPEGKVSAHVIQPGGALSLLNEVESAGKAPCHLEVDAEGAYLMVANYAGDPAIFPLDAEGRLSAAAATLHLEGSGPDPKRQTHSHPHGITLTPEGAWVTDLGIDRIAAVTIAPGSLALAEDRPRSVTVQPGDGPRHLALSPCGRLAAVVNELSNTVTLFRRENGTLRALDTCSTLPEGWEGTTHTAEILFHPTAPVLYATNRGYDTVAVFTYDRETGQLEAPRWLPSGGEKPQALAINARGTLLLVANMPGGVVTLFPVDPSTGQPGEPVATQPVAMPGSLRLVPDPHG